MLKRLTAFIALALLPHAAIAAPVLVGPTDLIGSRTTPPASGMVGLGRWGQTAGGIKVSWSISFDGSVWTYTYTLLDADGTALSPAGSHVLLEVSSFITAANRSTFIFDANTPLVGPNLWNGDPNSPNTSSPGGNGANPNLPADVYAIKFDSSQAVYTFKSIQAPMWGDIYVKGGRGLNGGPATTAWNTGLGTDPNDNTQVFTNWVPVPDTLTTETCTDALDNDGDSLVDCADPDCNTKPCDDERFCTVGDTCTAGVCDGTSRNCGDAVSCTIDSCDEANDTCNHVPSDAACGDGLFCNGTETCNPSTGCQPGTPPNCNDSVTCTTDACDETNDICTHTPSNAACSDGLFCSGVEICDLLDDCQPGGDPCPGAFCDEANDVCTGCLVNADCDNSVFCDGDETCGQGGVCQPGTPPNCNDDVACTIDSCDETSDQCDHTPSNAFCSDGQFCTGTETCHPTDGCKPGTPPTCGDTVSCTDDSCNEIADQCDNTPNHAFCDDGLFCTGTEICSPLDGCQPGTPPTCDDGVPCTDDSCNQTSDQCDNTPNDSLCNDGLFCTGTETCILIAGCQPGTPPTCNDEVPCTDDSCSAITDQCDHTPNDGLCDDGLFCTGTETCDPINDCQNGNDPCTGQNCNETTDSCVPCAANADCDNGLFCDGQEVCGTGGGCQPGTPPSCGDTVLCTDDSCNEIADQCDNTPNDGLCDDGLYCTGMETCDPIDGCQDGNDPCTGQSCDETSDTCVACLNNADCGDLAYCNGEETCVSGTCEPGSNPCPAGQTCDEIADQCETIPCGNGTLDPGEQCEPPNPETCDNFIDDDNDELIDCHDPDCASPGIPPMATCSGTCQEVGECKPIKRDPAIIRFGKNGRPDFFSVHGRVDAQLGDFDPTTQSFSFALYNNNGVIYSGTLLVGDLQPAGRQHGLATRLRFRDPSAKLDPGNSLRDGIYKAAMRFRRVCQDDSYTMKLRIYGDFSLATESYMTMQVYGVNEIGSVSADWTRRNHGWILELSQFNDNSQGSFCR